MPKSFKLTVKFIVQGISSWQRKACYYPRIIPKIFLYIFLSLYSRLYLRFMHFQHNHNESSTYIHSWIISSMTGDQLSPQYSSWIITWVFPQLYPQLYVRPMIYKIYLSLKSGILTSFPHHTWLLIRKQAGWTQSLNTSRGSRSTCEKVLPI